ncbi:MAG: agmatinase [Pseudomonadota bacterium]|nr:agmatinase [Pseudomonadota bacterium]
MAKNKASRRLPGDGAFRRSDLTGTEIEPSYAGALSFMRRRYTRDLTGVDLAITGIPFDQAVSNRPGTRFGPEAIRKASAQLAWGPFWPWFFDPFATLAAVDYGDCYFDWGRKEDVARRIEDHAAAVIESGASLVSFGGDHFVSYPLLKAHAKKYGPLSLVHFDAHRDVEPDEGGRVDHGTMFNLAVRDGVIDARRSIQVGIRTTYHGERTYGFKIVYADEVHAAPAAAIARTIRKAVGKRPAYLTFDIDCLDPAFAPGTGTPVPGGLSSHQALSILRELKEVDFVGMDVVEVSPAYDHAEITALAAATIALEYICLRAWRKGARPNKLPR